MGWYASILGEYASLPVSHILFVVFFSQEDLERYGIEPLNDGNDREDENANIVNIPDNNLLSEEEEQQLCQHFDVQNETFANDTEKLSYFNAVVQYLHSILEQQ